MTPLHQAAVSGQVKVVKILLEKGADPDAVDIYGRKPLDSAAVYGHFEVMKMLKSRKNLSAQTL